VTAEVFSLIPILAVASVWVFCRKSPADAAAANAIGAAIFWRGLRNWSD
jgi:hypothetical protein